MSSEDKPDVQKTILGTSPVPEKQPSPGQYIVTKPNDRTIVGGMGGGRPATPSTPAATVVAKPQGGGGGVVVTPPAAATVVLQPGGEPMPAPPVVPNGTPLPQPVPATVAGRARRPSEGPSGIIPRSSAWDTHTPSTPGSDPGSDPNSDGTTGVHQMSSMPHPGVRINQYEMIKMIGEGGMGT
ncbi:MAG: hypothetical protein HOV81_37545, partial [Kofleriaceae bacterium]|nr:hypothetical protein [Kofleriaceae bacterium]